MFCREEMSFRRMSEIDRRGATVKNRFELADAVVWATTRQLGCNGMEKSPETRARRKAKTDAGFRPAR
jgi:hypothetical protein